MTRVSSDVLKTKQHYDILDGLRGVAALAVVVFHFMEVVYTDATKNVIAHGFLAVDFFFCLSGFVIGYAYDDRISKMGVIEFFKSRLIRLHPLVILGSVLGLLGFLFDPFSNVSASYSASKTALIFLSSILLIPHPVMTERFLNLFSFNAPAWSLFWEYIANVTYAFILWRVGRRWLLLLVVIAAGGICLVSYHSHNVTGGWSGPTFWDGGARVAFSFLAGLLIYRRNWIIKNNLGFGGVAVLLAAAFLMPFNNWVWFTEPLVMILYFPLLISLGAGTKLSPGLKSICIFSGNISYPLYMTHYAAIWIFANYLAVKKPEGLQLIFVILAGIILLVSFAWLVMATYDIPVRKWLTSMRKQKI